MQPLPHPNTSPAPHPGQDKALQKMGYELKASRARAIANQDEGYSKQLNLGLKKLEEVHAEILAEILRPTPSIEDTGGKCVCLAPFVRHDF